MSVDLATVDLADLETWFATPRPRDDTFDLFGNGVPFATGIHTYADAVRFGRIASGRWPGCMIYMVYSGVYSGGQIPAPLAAFCAGKQLPLVVRLMPIEWYASGGAQREPGMQAIGLLPLADVRRESAEARAELATRPMPKLIS